MRIVVGRIAAATPPTPEKMTQLIQDAVDDATRDLKENLEKQRVRAEKIEERRRELEAIFKEKGIVADDYDYDSDGACAPTPPDPSPLGSTPLLDTH